MKEVLPEAFTKQTIQHYTFKHGRYSREIYLLLLITIIGLFALLPIIKVPISQSAQGHITSSEDSHLIMSPVSARIEMTRVVENAQFVKGDTIMTFRNENIMKNLEYLNSQINLLHLKTEDLLFLLSGKKNKNLLNTEEYRQVLIEYQARISHLELMISGSQKVMDRQLELYKAQVISKVEYERDELKHETNVKELDLYQSKVKAIWQSKVSELNDQLTRLNTDRSNYELQIHELYVIAPVDGTIKNALGLSEEQFIERGVKLAEMSPDFDLIALCSVPASEIGLLELNQKASIKVDAYNYNDWGVISGEVKDISKDSYLSEQGFRYYLVKCILDQKSLNLENGVIGNLERGMTVNVSFLVTKRSLFQLLFDNIDDWLNPYNS
ncbi:MAG: HlyD family efflux transporter periplasmic adaptor subunit [Cytophagales bacterium]|nr:HlyD family efflux transporter periplasmic adaptor subunit [Cytophagales bacterium]